MFRGVRRYDLPLLKVIGLPRAPISTSLAPCRRGFMIARVVDRIVPSGTLQIFLEPAERFGRSDPELIVGNTYGVPDPDRLLLIRMAHPCPGQ
ncbi:hypothetical protein NDU88_004706 [Pleurodeles waltl]|uniref:Uncharacterized protein n=1 Tax=Pleurodeles waltl TaxID=8319 RepID=A0AAV7T8J6_PLEWA|nr:hypothetical protein NDU88_004706 [Pleurodeles waltl]